MDIAGNYWEYNAEKSFYQMLLGGVCSQAHLELVLDLNVQVDYLLLGVLLNNQFVINKEEYDLCEVHSKVCPASCVQG